MAQENTRESQIDALRDMVIEAQELAQRLPVDIVYDDGELYVVDLTTRRNFRATLKERQEGQPCFIEIEPRGYIGMELGEFITLDMELGTTFEEAKDLASRLNDQCRSVRISGYDEE